jgi:Domain of unknown function (DUF222)
VVEQLRWVADPDTAEGQVERRRQRRGLWLSATLEGMVAVDGRLEPEAGQTVLAALEPLARPADAQDARSGSQRRADALTELARRQLEGGGCRGVVGCGRSCWGRWTWTASSTTGRAWAVGWVGGSRWGRRRVGGWPVRGR